MTRYPDFLAGSPEFRAMQEALEPELAALWEYRDSAAAQLNVETATWGLKYWEQTLGIPVEGARGLEFRRSRVRAKLRGAGVTTAEMIRNVSESFTNGTVEVTEYPRQFRLIIKFVDVFGIPPNMEDLTAALLEIMPAHLAIYYAYSHLLVRNVREMTIGTLQAQPINRFAFFEHLPVWQIRGMTVGKLQTQLICQFAF